MEIVHGDTPSYQRLRPLKPVRTEGFPVYQDLTDKLVSTASHPNHECAHVLGTCAGYAYSDADTVGMIMARMGLEDNHCVMVAQYVDVMFICSTAFLIQSRDGRVLVICYRGTTATSLINWLTDFDVYPQKIPIAFNDAPKTFDVHGGFYRNVRATRYEIINTVRRALEGQSIKGGDKPASMPHSLEALYVTGHSLGAAMASMMAVMLTTEGAYRPIAEKLRAVYTFGQPMIGTPELAQACNADEFLRERVIRYIYGNDTGPQLPPTASGEFAHFGQEYQYRTRGETGEWYHNSRPTKQLGNLAQLVTNPLTFFTRQIEITRHLRFGADIYDHLPHNYIAALTPDGVQTEFGR